MTELCPWCGEPDLVDVFEVWLETREFMIETCCEARHAEACAELALLDREEFRDWFERATGVRVRQAVDSCGAMLLDYGLDVRPIEQGDARAFIAAHHRHVARTPGGWLFGYGIHNGAERVGVVWVGRPGAIPLDDGRTAEVSRLCVKETIPGIVWNACSQLYGHACREIQRRGYNRVTTYTLGEEEGKTLIAAGFRKVKRTRGGSRHRKSRPRTDAAPTTPKDRWERLLKPNPKKLRPLRDRFLIQGRLFEAA